MARQRQRKVRIQRESEVHIAQMAPGGWGVAGEGRNRLSVWGGFLGDVVDVRVVQRQRGRVEAAIERVIARKMETIVPSCTHFDVCGGCLWQHVSYADQCALKNGIVQFCFEEVGLDTELIGTVIGSSEIFAYRNKMDFSFGRDAEGKAALGMYTSPAKLSQGHLHLKFPPVFNVDACYLQSEVANRIVVAVRNAVLDLGLSFYDVIEQDGILRSLVIRESAKNGALLVYFVAAEDCRELLMAVAESIVAAEPSVAGVLLHINDKRSKNATPQSEVVLAGQGRIQEAISDLVVDVSPGSFLQVNTLQAEKLYDVALRFAQLTGVEKVLDLYCGIGTLSLLLARQAGRVIGVEVVDGAVDDAERNAEQNGVDNCEFLCGDVLAIMPDLIARGEHVDVVTVNPPRAGIFRSVVKRICQVRPERIVYISCNPQTLARDLLRFEKGGYKTVAVQPVDLFPHTPHIEVVAKLEAVF